MLVVIMILKVTATFQVGLIVSHSWNITILWRSTVVSLAIGTVF